MLSAKGTYMRALFALALFTSTCLVAPGTASSIAPNLGDQAATIRTLGHGAEQVKRQPAEMKRKVRRYDRRYSWTKRPYWRPYQYRYWKFYYPYGGPLF
jgi:hypothetical protein